MYSFNSLDKIEILRSVYTWLTFSPQTSASICINLTVSLALFYSLLDIPIHMFIFFFIYFLMLFWTIVFAYLFLNKYFTFYKITLSMDCFTAIGFNVHQCVSNLSILSF